MLMTTSNYLFLNSCVLWNMLFLITILNYLLPQTFVILWKNLILFCKIDLQNKTFHPIMSVCRHESPGF